MLWEALICNNLVGFVLQYSRRIKSCTVFQLSNPNLLFVCRGTATSAGVYFQSWNADGVGSAAVVYDWLKGTLEVMFTNPAAGDVEHSTEFDVEHDALRRVGGPVNVKPGEPVALRMLVDHSCLEVYSSSGEVLSTRVYRGKPPPDASAGINLVSYGGTAKVDRVVAWEMGNCFDSSDKRAAMASGVFGKGVEPLMLSPAASLDSELAVMI